MPRSFPLDDIAGTFRGLGHPRRMRLFALLASDPHVGDSLGRLVKASRIPLASIYHHLREMEKAGLVSRRRKGAEMTFQLQPRSLRFALVAARTQLETRILPD